MLQLKAIYQIAELQQPDLPDFCLSERVEHRLKVSVRNIQSRINRKMYLRFVCKSWPNETLATSRTPGGLPWQIESSRLYVATDDPTPQLRKLIEFIMVYIPSRFSINCNPKILQVTTHFKKNYSFQQLLGRRAKISRQSCNVTEKCIQGSPRAMLFDERKHIRNEMK